MAIECEVLTSSTLNGLKTLVNGFFASNTKRLVSVSHGVKDGEYTALILTFGEQ
jgi:hypothetical protein